MSTLEDLEASLARYSTEFRHPSQCQLVMSKIYDLFPETGSLINVPVESKWPDPWPNAESPGIYAMLDEDLFVRYIGKASMKSSIGRRLSLYFIYEDRAKNKRCKLSHPEGWLAFPRFVVSVPVSLSFEAPSIEEFLILQLLPPENLQGRPRNEKVD